MEYIIQFPNASALAQLRICFVQNVFPGPRATWFGFMGEEVVFRAIFKGEGFG